MPVFHFLHPFIMQKGTQREVCWMLEYIMAEVSSPDEYQANLLQRSCCHLPGAEPDSQMPPWTYHRGLISSTYSKNPIRTTKVNRAKRETGAGSGCAPLGSRRLQSLFIRQMSASDICELNDSLPVIYKFWLNIEGQH